jgi:hypothetical protein
MIKPYIEIVKLIRESREREREKEIDLRGEGRGWCTSVATTTVICTPRPEACPCLETIG